MGEARRVKVCESLDLYMHEQEDWSYGGAP